MEDVVGDGSARSDGRARDGSVDGLKCAGNHPVGMPDSFAIFGEREIAEKAIGFHQRLPVLPRRRIEINLGAIGRADRTIASQGAWARTGKQPIGSGNRSRIRTCGNGLHRRGIGDFSFKFVHKGLLDDQGEFFRFLGNKGKQGQNEKLDQDQSKDHSGEIQASRRAIGFGGLCPGFLRSSPKKDGDQEGSAGQRDANDRVPVPGPSPEQEVAGRSSEDEKDRSHLE